MASELGDQKSHDLPLVQTLLHRLHIISIIKIIIKHDCGTGRKACTNLVPVMQGPCAQEWESFVPCGAREGVMGWRRMERGAGHACEGGRIVRAGSCYILFLFLSLLSQHKFSCAIICWYRLKWPHNSCWSLHWDR